MQLELKEIIERLARMEIKQNTQCEFAKVNHRKIDKVHTFIVGNGKVGILEDVRILKNRWKAVLWMVTIFLGGLITAIAKNGPHIFEKLAKLLT